MDLIDIHEHIGIGDEEFALFDVPQHDGFAPWLDQALHDAPTKGWLRVLLPPVFFKTTAGIADVRRLNDLMAAAGGRKGAGITASFGVVEPHHGAAAFEELERISKSTLKGIVFSPRTQGVFADTPEMVELVKHADRQNLAVMVHVTPYCNNEVLWRIWNLAERCANVTLVALGGFAAWEQMQAIMANRERAPNLLYDTAGLNDFQHVLSIAKTLGPERLLFGTGAHDRRSKRSTQAACAKAVAAGLFADGDDRILRRNAQKFLKLRVAS